MLNPLRHWFCGKVRSPAEVALWALLHHKVISQPSLLCHKTSVLSLSGFLHRKYGVGIESSEAKHIALQLWKLLDDHDSVEQPRESPRGGPKVVWWARMFPSPYLSTERSPNGKKTPSKPPPRRLDLKPFCVSQYNTCCQSYSWCDHSVLRLWHQKMNSAKMHIHHMLQLFEVCVCRDYPGTQQTPLLFFQVWNQPAGRMWDWA